MSKSHSVRLNRELCMGCTNCIKRCPTGAIRVRNGKAVISDERCIDCGECIRACPHRAKSTQMDSISQLSDYDYTIALAAPSLYAQFGPPATRSMVLAALCGVGFDDVYEVARGADIVTRATSIYLEEALARGISPLISSACPVVVRLVQMRFPSLIGNLVPLDSPMEVTARLARSETASRRGLKPEQIGLFFISPCPAKRSATINPIGRLTSAVDGSIGMSEVYPLMLANLDKLTPELLGAFEQRRKAESSGVRWAYAGGEAIALTTSRYLAVDGIHNVIEILEEVENERLRDIDFIEANSCTGGCIGGVLTVANRFSAKTRHRNYVEAAAREHPDRINEISDDEIRAAGPWPEKLEPNTAMKLDDDISEALRKYEQLKQIASELPGLDCGSCGAPNCEALAEDIVRGQATDTDCIFRLKDKIRSVADQMSLLQKQMNRHVDQEGADAPQP